MTKWKVLSLFDGVSCARLALERAGVEVESYYASEINKYAIKVTQANRPDTVQLGDVKNILWDCGHHDCKPESIDLLIGGSPCQDLSIAKKDRKGLEGERSGLFYEYVRILNEVKPKYFVLENVASMSKKDKQIITDALGDIEPVMINASLVSAQNRKRLFWIGKLVGNTYEQVHIEQPEDKGIYLKDILESGDVDRLKSYCVDANYHKGASWEQYKAKCRRQLVLDNQGNEKLKSNTVRTSGRGSGINDRHNWDTIRVVPVALRNRGQGKKPEYNKTGRANSLTTVQTDSMVEEDAVIRKLTPVECERLQSMPDNWTNPTGDISNTQRYKMCGNAFNVEVVTHIIRTLTNTP